jgi:hypothetical protein
MSTLSLSMRLSMYLCLVKGREREREKEWGHRKVLPMIDRIEEYKYTLTIPNFFTKYSLITLIFLI